MKHYLLVVEEDIEPMLHGPYKNGAARDDAAFCHKNLRGDEDGLYRLDVNKRGIPRVRPFGAMELDKEGRTQ
jgi:hypothetical protein